MAIKETHMGANNMNELLELVKGAQAKAVDDITKNFVQPGSATQGLQGYDLARAAAQRWADRLGKSVYLYEDGAGSKQEEIQPATQVA